MRATPQCTGDAASMPGLQVRINRSWRRFGRGDIGVHQPLFEPVYKAVTPWSTP